MESVVPPQITVELTQILSNLVLGDNEIRSRYFSWVLSPATNGWVAHIPELYLLALSQFEITADVEVVRPYSKHGKTGVRELK